MSKFVDPKPWLDGEDQHPALRHRSCRFPESHGCSHRPRTRVRYYFDQLRIKLSHTYKVIK